MKNMILAVLCTACTLVFAIDELFAQHGNTQLISDKTELAKLKTAVELNLDSLSYHQKYIRGMGLEHPELEKQYAVWMRKYPKNARIPYALAKGYLDAEDPKAKPYLLKAVEIDPKFADAWGGLWTDGERWGDFKLSNSYLRKATEADPSNAAYAFYYASSFKDDEVKRRELSLEVAKRFPNLERGAQALYWLAARSKNKEDKIKYFELLKNSFSPQKFNWSASGMPQYFSLLLNQDPQKALALAEEMAKSEEGERKQWPAMEQTAKSIAQARELLDRSKGAEALSVLNTVKLSRGSGFLHDLLLLKAKANEVGGNTVAAYDSLIVAFAKSPSVTIHEAINTYAKKLNKSPQALNADLWKQLDAGAKPATPFHGLKRYMSEGSASLSDFKGKVVLLTYWFPGCGPCRGEFPHFENVLRKLKGQAVDYVGLNIVSQQNPYVVPFMKSSGYSFTPLEDVKDRVKGNLDNKGMAPMNFLIDKDGQLYFSNFRTDGDNEEDLELMISLLLNKQV